LDHDRTGGVKRKVAQRDEAVFRKAGVNRTASRQANQCASSERVGVDVGQRCARCDHLAVRADGQILQVEVAEDRARGDSAAPAGAERRVDRAAGRVAADDVAAGGDDL